MQPPYSKRFNWDAEAHPLGVTLAAQIANGAAVIDLSDANPTRMGFHYPVDPLPLNRPPSWVYTPAPRGLPEARRAVADYYADAGRIVSDDAVLMTTSTSESYSLLFKLLGDPGDEILIPQPGYPLLSHLAGFEGLACHAYPLRHDASSGWAIDIEILSALITGRTRAVVVVNPNNPTGNYIRNRELAAIDDLCQRHRVALIIDEVFLDYPAAGPVGSTLNRTTALTFVLNGFSKTLGLPQMKLGWIVVGGGSRQAEAAIGHLETLMDFYLTVGAPVQQAAPQMLARRTVIQNQIRGRIQKNEKWLRSKVAGCANITLHPREGGWYAVLFIDDPVGDDDRAISLLRNEQVLIHPGRFYDFRQEGFVVISLLLPPDRFIDGVQRLIRRFGHATA